MMSNEEKLKKLTAYFGFAAREGGLFAGMRLEEKLDRGKVSLLILLKDCPEKVRKEYLSLASRCKRIHILNYEGDINIALLAGYEKVNAVGIRDFHLGDAVFSVLDEKEETKEDNR